MDNKFELNLSKLFNSYFQEPLKSEDFKESENIFSIFDLNKDGKIDNSEIDNICKQLYNYSSKNTSDTRQNANTIFDEIEAKSFIEENKTKEGKTYAQLGVTISDIFNFIETLIKNSTTEVQKEKVISFQKIESSISEDAVIEEPLELNDEQKRIAKELANVPERKENQFNKEECERFAQLSKEDLEKAKKLFFVEGRENQFSADDIIMLVTEFDGKFKVNQENYKRFNEFLLLKNSANQELTSEDIVILMSLPPDQIDSAIQLLSLKNRAENPLSVRNIVMILKCGSNDLLQMVINNPRITDFDETKSISVSWLSVKDNENNVTYRYIKGQQYPEEIREEIIDDKSFRRIIVNKNLNIEQTMIFNNKDDKNPLRIETKHLSENGKVAYIEVMEQGINPGTPDVYTIDANGNKTYLQQTFIDEQTGIQTTKKRFTDDNGNLTEFSYSAIGENEYSVDYRITDVQGKELFEKHTKLKQIDNNKFEYTNNNKTFLLEKQDDKVVVTDKSNNKSYTLNYNDYIESDNNPNIFKQSILKIPVDILIFIIKNPLSLSYGTKTRDNQGYCRADHKAIDIGTITKTDSEKELNEAFITIIIHELGHYIDNPDLSEDEKDILSLNEEFQKIYKEELQEFIKNHSSEEMLVICQFNGIGYRGKSPETQAKRSATETLAESNMITNTNSKNWTSSRSYYLQRYFPRTIAFASKLINERIQK